MPLTRSFLATLILGLVPVTALASDGAEVSALEKWETAPETVFAAAEIDLDDWQWRARPVIVFANSENDPAFARQLDLLRADISEVIDRDIILVTDTAPAEMSALRTKLRPKGFMLVLIGKDGQVKLRKPFPWDMRELSRVIDKMPMRQQEMRAAR